MRLIRQVPEIDGSQGAFIGLVVALSVLIVVCCAAVFYLLRHHEPTEQDRAARRERYRRTRAFDASLSGTGPSTASLVGSLSDKMKQLWQSTAGGGRRGGRGWIRAGSDDEWAIHSDRDAHEGSEMPRSLAVLEPESGDALGPGAGAVGGVRVVESPTSDAPEGFVHPTYAYPYVDPFSAKHATGSPLSSPTSSPREASVDGRESPGDQRHRSTMSNASVWTHGSKFVEDI